MSGPHPWADRLKADPRVKTVTVTWENRDSLPAALLHELALRENARGASST